MPEELTNDAVWLIQRCPQLINLFAERVNALIDNWSTAQEESESQGIEIAHVEYSIAECGYEK